MKRPFLVPACLALTLLACDDEPTPSEGYLSYQEAVENYEPSCDLAGIPTEGSYFARRINGSEVCFATDTIKSYSFLSPINTYIVGGGAVSSAATGYSFGIKSYTGRRKIEGIEIETPLFPYDTPARVVLDSLLQPGTLSLRDSRLDEEGGFNISFSFSSLPARRYEDQNGEYQPSATGARLETALGDQEGSSLKVMELNVAEIDTAFIYQITLEINCELYWVENVCYSEPDNRKRIYFGRIENGVLHTELTINK